MEIALPLAFIGLAAFAILQGRSFTLFHVGPKKGGKNEPPVDVEPREATKRRLPRHKRRNNRAA